MKIFRMLFFGLIGIIVSIIGVFVMVSSTETIYGLVVSLLGSLVGALAVLGYIGKGKLEPSQLKKILVIGTIYGLLGVALPYILFGLFQNALDILFISFGALGGYEAAKMIFAYRTKKTPETAPEEKVEVKELSIENKKIRSYVIQKRFVSFILSQLWVLCFIVVIGKLFFPGLSVAWILVIPIAIYELWRRKIFQVSHEEIEKAKAAGLKSIWKTNF